MENLLFLIIICRDAAAEAMRAGTGFVLESCGPSLILVRAGTMELLLGTEVFVTEVGCAPCSPAWILTTVESLWGLPPLLSVGVWGRIATEA